MWQAIPAPELSEWIRTKTALHALPESREALRVAWKQYLAGVVANMNHVLEHEIMFWNMIACSNRVWVIKHDHVPKHDFIFQNMKLCSENVLFV